MVALVVVFVGLGEVAARARERLRMNREAGSMKCIVSVWVLAFLFLFPFLFFPRVNRREVLVKDDEAISLYVSFSSFLGAGFWKEKLSTLRAAA